MSFTPAALRHRSVANGARSRPAHWCAPLAAAAIALCALHAVPANANTAAALTAPASPTASSLFARLRPAVLTVRTVGPGSDRTLSYGSGFFVDGRGRVVTNYHVVADHLRNPGQHTLRTVDALGREGPAQVLAFDIVNDLALLQAKTPAAALLPPPAADPSLAVGAALFSLGNPQDLGVTLMAGHFSSRMQALGVTRIHFSGSINAGMSGGPVVDANGTLVGVNVSRQTRGEQISFLVPADQVRALLARSPAGHTLDLSRVNEETTTQLLAWQTGVRERAFVTPWATVPIGPYRAPEFLVGELKCWASDNEDARTPPPIRSTRVGCREPQDIYLGDNLASGRVGYQRTHLRGDGVNRIQFARALESVASRDLTSQTRGPMAEQQCRDEHLRAGASGQLPVRLLWCAAAYRDLPGLYDIDISVASQDRPLEAVVTRISLEGVAWDTGLAFTRHLLETLQ